MNDHFLKTIRKKKTASMNRTSRGPRESTVCFGLRRLATGLLLAALVVGFDFSGGPSLAWATQDETALYPPLLKDLVQDKETVQGKDKTKQEADQESAPSKAEPKSETKKDKAVPKVAATKRPERRKRVPRYTKYLKFSPAVHKALKKQSSLASASTVEVYVEGQKEAVSLGMVVDAKGFVMTKASRLTGRVRCKLSRGKMVPAIVYGIDPLTDLALLRVQSYNLAAVPLNPSYLKSTKEGYWLLSPNSHDDLVSMGVLSVLARKIPPTAGFIGIQMAAHKKGVQVREVIAGSAAERYGVKMLDVIVKIEDKSVGEPLDIAGVLKAKRAGDVVTLTVLRGTKEESKSIRVVLGDRRQDNPDFQRSNRQNRMAGELSARRDDFPMAIQHDTVLKPENCGGPLTDMDGHVIGMNIARSGRVMSYALPIDVVKKVFERLATGEFSPDVVYGDRVAEYVSLLESLNVKMNRLTKEKTTLDLDIQKAETVVQGQQADVDLVQSQLDELEKKMAEMKRKLAKKKKVLASGKVQKVQIQSKIRSKGRHLKKATQEKKNIEKKRRALLFGAD